MHREKIDGPSESKLFMSFSGGRTVRTRQRNPRFVPKAMPRTLGTARGITSSLTGRRRQSGTDSSPVDADIFTSSAKRSLQTVPNALTARGKSFAAANTCLPR